MGINRLSGMRCYECGPIDDVTDHGVGWRIEMSAFLESLGAVPLDPLNKPIEGYSEDPSDIVARKNLKKTGQYDELAKLVKQIRAIDLRMCDVCDFAIVYINNDVVMTGTHEEWSLLNRSRKPIVVMCEQGKARLADWFFGALPHQLFFGDWQGVKNYLHHINKDAFIDDLNGRWRFFNY